VGPVIPAKPHEVRCRGGIQQNMPCDFGDTPLIFRVQRLRARGGQGERGRFPWPSFEAPLRVAPQEEELGKRSHTPPCFPFSP
jgi:hypothetical protein